jgi:putative FmdB family regulatory protein
VPFYEYACDDCEVLFTVRKRMAEHATPEQCPECDQEARKVISAPSFILKGDDWASKNNRIRGQMAESRRKAGIRQGERVRDGAIPGGKLVPNVDGERVDTWDEAGKLAASKGKDTGGYKRMAAKEKSLTKKVPPT